MLLCVLLAAAGLAAQQSTTAPRQPASGEGSAASSAAKVATTEAAPTAKIPPAGTTELDRVVAIVNGDIILDSGVDEERRFAAFEPYGDDQAKFSRDKAIEQLINRDLILQQIRLQPEDQVSDSDVTKQIDQLRKTIPACKEYHCETQQGWDRFLADHGFTEDSLFARWKQRMEVLLFIEERFRMGIRITPDQIRDYYEHTMLPEYARRHAKAPRLEAISKQIEDVLLEQQVTSLLDDWLKSLRAQGNVVVLHPGEAAP